MQGSANDDLCFGLTDDEVLERFTKAIELSKEKKRAMGVPIPCFDEEKQRGYLKYADGRREYVS